MSKNKLIDACKSRAAQAFIREAERSFGDERIESPIEEAMLWELVAQGLNAGMEVCIGSHQVGEGGQTLIDVGDPSPLAGASPDRLILFHQVRIEGYRVDFVIAVDIKRGKYRDMLVVECDGHDYHERTKEQARRDKSRDMKLQSIVGKVLRFTGSEIWSDPVACSREAISALWERAEFEG